MRQYAEAILLKGEILFMKKKIKLINFIFINNVTFSLKLTFYS